MAVTTGPPVAPSPAAPSRRPLAYIPALDGLRAVAVVGVMFFHGGVAWVPGGYLGVDVFFVLSGYLITTLLLRERVGTGAIDLKAFWVRRLRRLLPALLVLLAAVGIATPFLVEAAERTSVRGDGLAALSYVANWRFVFTEQSYFAGVPSPLRHLWSLAVEEQWYVLFPVVAAVALRRAHRIVPFLVALGVATAASALWMAHLASGSVDPSRAYYGTDSRAHSLLVGAILACAAAQWPLHRLRRTLAVTGVVGAVGIAAAYALVAESETWMYRGGFLGLAVLTAGLVAAIVLPRPALPLTGLLAARPLVAIGKVSYGLYLWHWPVNVFLTPDRLGLEGTSGLEQLALFALRTAVAVAFTLASYFLVEVPVRRHGVDGLRLRFPWVLRSRPATALACAGLVAWLLVAGTLRVPDSAVPTQAATGVPTALAGAETGVPELPDETVPTIPDTIRQVVEGSGIPPVTDRPPKVMVVGDSVAWTMSAAYPVVPDTIEVTSRALIGCGVVEGFALPGGKIDKSAQRCGDWPSYWQRGAALWQPDIVVIQYGAWEVYDYKQGAETVEAMSEEMRGEIREGLDRGIEAVLQVKPDARFVFLGVPCMRERNPQLGGADSERNDPERVAWFNGVIDDYSADLGPRSGVIDLGELLCPGGEFRAVIDGIEVRPDGSHYYDGTSGPVWNWLAPRLVDIARQPVVPDGTEEATGAPTTDGPTGEAPGPEPEGDGRPSP